MESIYYVMCFGCHRRCKHCYEDRFRPYERRDRRQHGADDASHLAVNAGGVGEPRWICFSPSLQIRSIALRSRVSPLRSGVKASTVASMRRRN